jgi:carboxyl-terminal processing protease
VRRRALAALCLAAAAGLAPARAADNAPAGSSAAGEAPFNAAAAWHEFAELLRLDYAYFERPGVDGPKILAHFADRAHAAKSRSEFVAVAKVVARNFADPHFNVGPGAPTDPGLVPTASDLFGDVVDSRCVVRAVRGGSDAAAQGVPVGATVGAIDGHDCTARIAALLGRPIAALTRLQAQHGLNLALAGVRGQPRHLVLRAGGGPPRTFTLRSPDEHARAVAAARAVVAERRGDIGLIRFNNSLGRDETIVQFKAAVQELLDTRAMVIDLRNTPSGGNTTVARAILGHFVTRERPYQVHAVPGEQRRHGVPRKFVELVAPLAPHYRGRVFVLGGRWTGSMGEGLVIGFDAIGQRTVGSPMGHLLGALFHEKLTASGAQVELGQEQLLHVNGTPREAFRPAIAVDPAEARPDGDPAFDAVLGALRSGGATAQSRAK